MPVEIDQLDMTVEGTPAGGGGATPTAPLPQITEAWRAAWLAARQAEQQARWAATDRDDQR